MVLPLLVQAVVSALGDGLHGGGVVDGALRIPAVLGVRAVLALLAAKGAGRLLLFPLGDVLLLRLLGERVEVLAGYEAEAAGDAAVASPFREGGGLCGDFGLEPTPRFNANAAE